MAERTNKEGDLRVFQKKCNPRLPHTAYASFYPVEDEYAGIDKITAMQEAESAEFTDYDYGFVIFANGQWIEWGDHSFAGVLNQRSFLAEGVA